MQPSNANDFKRIDAIVSNILSLFEKYEIHATWATVGLLAHKNRAELFDLPMQFKIPYANENYSPFPLDDKKYDLLDQSALFGCHKIKTILNTPYQELGSHTYSHFYCCEEGISAEDFNEDCLEMEKIGKRFEHSFKSIVFPRNQVNTACLKACFQHGITTFRGNQQNRFWTNSSFEDESFLKKTGRVLDAYFPISKTQAFSISELPKEEELVNVPANRFLRPQSGKKILERLKLNRIKNEMNEAAKRDTVYHLWWHPHNFLSDTDKALKQLEMVLIHYKSLAQENGFSSLNLTEIHDRKKA